MVFFYGAQHTKNALVKLLLSALCIINQRVAVGTVSYVNLLNNQ